ncbi:hypothetical protein L484_022423 [Morus notabilis]|uniref:Uncharacterized protein n=1 Tax=Morus notabilis TaxID=981085 RepID=W9R2G5_9ROSA|nr:hypothetical protein L484_022423 [Morus notabilis]
MGVGEWFLAAYFILFVLNVEMAWMGFHLGCTNFGKPDLAPAAWVRRLVTLCDQAPAIPFDAVQRVREKEFGQITWLETGRYSDSILATSSYSDVRFAQMSRRWKAYERL